MVTSLFLSPMNHDWLCSTHSSSTAAQDGMQAVEDTARYTRGCCTHEGHWPHPVTGWGHPYNEMPQKLPRLCWLLPGCSRGPPPPLLATPTMKPCPKYLVHNVSMQ
jgi:hypothetical protein